jgi:hypothetical protein
MYRKQRRTHRNRARACQPARDVLRRRTAHRPRAMWPAMARPTTCRRPRRDGTASGRAGSVVVSWGTASGPGRRHSTVRPSRRPIFSRRVVRPSRSSRRLWTRYTVFMSIHDVSNTGWLLRFPFCGLLTEKGPCPCCLPLHPPGGRRDSEEEMADAPIRQRVAPADPVGRGRRPGSGGGLSVGHRAGGTRPAGRSAEGALPVELAGPRALRPCRHPARLVATRGQLLRPAIGVASPRRDVRPGLDAGHLRQLFRRRRPPGVRGHRHHPGARARRGLAVERRRLRVGGPVPSRAVAAGRHHRYPARHGEGQGLVTGVRRREPAGAHGRRPLAGVLARRPVRQARQRVGTGGALLPRHLVHRRVRLWATFFRNPNAGYWSDPARIGDSAVPGVVRLEWTGPQRDRLYVRRRKGTL